MIRMKLLFASAFASAFVFLGGAVAPVVAFADESAEGAETSEIVSVEEFVEETESVENTAVFEQKTYVYIEDATKLELTLLSETTAVGEIYYYDTYTATITFTCTYIESDVVELYLPDESYFDSFRLHPNGYLIEYDDGVYIPPDIDDSEEEEETKLDFDDILEFAGTLAEKEGWGDEWEKALYYIENAATEKKVELMTVFIILVFIFLLADRTVKLIRWVRKRKKDTTSKDLQDIKTASGQQTTAINTLIDEEEKLVKEVHGANTEATTREKALAESIEYQNVAIRSFIRGTKIEQSLKDEAFRALNKSDELCDKAKK